MGSIEPMHRRPTVEAVTYIRRNALFTGGADDSRDEAVVAVA